MMKKLNRCIFIEDDGLLEIYNGIWNRVSNSINIARTNLQ